MALQFSTLALNAMLDGFEADLGASPVLKIWTGAAPANCAAANTGTELASMSLPADAMAAASGASKAKSGTWEDPTGNAAGTAGHFRLYKSDGTTCCVQGSVTATGGGGNMTLDNTSIAVGQQVTITAFTLNLTAGL